MRVDLFGDEVESLRWFSTFTQRSLGEAERGRDRARGRARARAPRAGRDRGARGRRGAARHRRAAAGRPLPRLPRPRARGTRPVLIAAEEDVEPALADHWQDVTARVPRRRRPPPLRRARGAIAPRSPSARASRLSSHRGRPADPLPRPGRRHAGALACARPSPSSRSSCARATAPSSPGRAAARASAPPTTSARLHAAWLDGNERRPPTASCASPRRRCATGFIAPAFQLAVLPEHRLIRRRRAEPTAARRAGRGALRSFADLRTGDIVVHEDHGVARFAGFDTKTVAGGHARLPRPRVPGLGPRVHARRPAREDLAATSAPAASTRRCRKLGGTRWEHDEGARPARRPGAGGRAAQPLRRAQAPRRARVRRGLRVAARVRGRPSRTTRRPTSATRSRPSRPTWRRRGRWTG